MNASLMHPSSQNVIVLVLECVFVMFKANSYLQKQRGYPRYVMLN
jgi:hypothetical protein